MPAGLGVVLSGCGWRVLLPNSNGPPAPTPLYRAYQLKEGLRLIFQMPIDQAVEALGRGVSCARRCRIRPS
jgi:hypothetical protein